MRITKELLREDLKDRHKQDCIQILHGKTNKCDCGLRDLTSALFTLIEAAQLTVPEK